MHFTMSHTTSLLCVSYLDHLSQIVTNIREIILQTTRVFFRRAWWKEVGESYLSFEKKSKKFHQFLTKWEHRSFHFLWG